MPEALTIGQANVAVTIAQTLTTYGKADETPSGAPAGTGETGGAAEPGPVSSLWSILRAGGAPARQRFTLRNLVLSEWVPRLPGLYFQPGAAHLRMQGQWVTQEGGAYRVYRPNAKSRHMMGGVGTLRPGVATDGWRLCSASEIDHEVPDVPGPFSEQVSGGHGNASAGIPIFMPDEVWTDLALEEGSVIDLVGASWRSFPGVWSEFFPSIKDLPRGCLVVERANQIMPRMRRVPSAVHPFSVMQYDSQDGPRLDFVYAQGLANVGGWRDEVQQFFNWFCNTEGRHGELILGADLVDPMWNALYDKPAALRAANPNDLALLEARALGTDLSERLIDLLQRWLTAAAGDGEILDALGGDIGLPPGWKVAGSMADRVKALLAESVKRHKLSALYDAAQHHGLQPDAPGNIEEAQRLAGASSASFAIPLEL